MASRTGIWTLNQLAKKMCAAIVTFTPIIQRTFPENAALQAALSAANAACAVLATETSNEFVYGD